MGFGFGGGGLIMNMPNTSAGRLVSQKYTTAGDKLPTVKATPLGCAETYGSG